MAVTYEWNISQMDSYPSFDTYTDVVFNVHWQVLATDDGTTASAYGTQGITYAEDRPFVPYAELTKDDIVGWTKSSMGDNLAVLEASLAKQIADAKDPPVIVLPLPWA
jgi:hypothetical protein